jgi:hypothetical protein
MRRTMFLVVLALLSISAAFAADEAAPQYLKLQKLDDIWIALTDATADNVQFYAAGAWQSLGLETGATDILVSSNQLYAATPAGLMHYMDDSWMALESTPCSVLTASHGFLLCLGEGQAVRADEAKLNGTPTTTDGGHAHHGGHSMGGSSDALAQVKPLPIETQGEKFVMLGDHTHALLADGALYRTVDVGLGYTAMPAPIEPVNLFNDANFDLWAETDDGLWRYDVAKNTWADAPVALPDNQLLAELFPFNDTLMARTVEGAVYRRAKGEWQPAEFPENVVIGDLSYQPPLLWALARDGRLFGSENGTTWQAAE